MLGQSPFFGQRLAELGNKKGRFSVLDRSKNQYQINQLTGCLQSKRVVTVLGISLHFGHDSMTLFHNRNADVRICRQVRRIAMLECRCCTSQSWDDNVMPNRTLEIGLACGASTPVFRSEHHRLGHKASKQQRAIEPTFEAQPG